MTHSFVHAALALGFVAGCQGAPQTAAPAAPTHGAESAASAWGYPYDADAWGGACKTGVRQSPIVLNPSLAGRSNGALAVKPAQSTVDILNDAAHYTVKYTMQYPGGPGVLTLDGVDYKLAQFHFHAPGEHQIQRQGNPQPTPFDMEMHLVHTGPNGTHVVLGVGIVAGQADNPIFAGALQWAKVPRDPGGKYQDAATFNPYEVVLNGNADVPKYWRYSGSLTTPGCNETVEWLVVDQPIVLSTRQIQMFTSLYNGNVRPVQPANGRQMTVSP